MKMQSGRHCEIDGRSENVTVQVKRVGAEGWAAQTTQTSEPQKGISKDRGKVLPENRGTNAKRDFDF
jgi:hypothetical protein